MTHVDPPAWSPDAEAFYERAADELGARLSCLLVPIAPDSLANALRIPPSALGNPRLMLHAYRAALCDEPRIRALLAIVAALTTHAPSLDTATLAELAAVAMSLTDGLTALGGGETALAIVAAALEDAASESRPFRSPDLN